MPAMELSHAYDAIVLWPRIGTQESGGPVASGTPEQIYGRWDDKKREVQSPTRGPIAIDGTIYQLDRDLKIGSMVWLGELTALPAAGVDPVDVMYVYSMDGTKDLKNRWVSRNALLVRSMDRIS